MMFPGCGCILLLCALRCVCGEARIKDAIQGRVSMDDSFTGAFESARVMPPMVCGMGCAALWEGCLVA